MCVSSAKSGRFEKAPEILHAMRSEGFTPDAMGFNAAILGYGARGRLSTQIVVKLKCSLRMVTTRCKSLQYACTHISCRCPGSSCLFESTCSSPLTLPSGLPLCRGLGARRVSTRFDGAGGRGVG